MSRLEDVISMIQRNGMRGEIWIDGSFLTEKLNPDDVDIVLVVHSSEYMRMNSSERRFFDWFRATSLYDTHRCDNYILIRDDTIPEFEYMYAYWVKQFGFSRGNNMKGLAVIQIPFVVQT